jgi:hypothetical protein
MFMSMYVVYYQIMIKEIIIPAVVAMAKSQSYQMGS